MILVEAIASGIVGLALVWLVLQPMVLPQPAAPEALDLPDPEETPRGRALLALKEIEFDRATGKLSDVDYEMLHARYAAAAIETMTRDAAGSDAIEAMVSARVALLDAPADGARRCRVHGPVPQDDALFCAECGLGLATSAGACVACGFTLPADAAFCPGCGVRVGA